MSISTITPATINPLGTTVINATQASATAALSTPTSAQYGSVGTNVMVTNLGPNTAYVRFGPAGVVATLPDAVGGGATPVPVGYFGLILARDPTTATNVAAICKTGETAEVCFTVGNGT